MSAVHSLLPKQVERQLGAILVDAGRLTLEQAERIMRLQREQGLRFGDAGLQLGLLTQADIEFALAHQFGYPCLVPGQSKVSRKLVAAYSARGPQVEALRALRGQLILRCFNDEREHGTLAIVSDARGEGRSFIAASLAIIFSQLGERTLLIDADMRHPSQHELFGVENRAGLSSVLSGRAGHEAVQRIPALLDLSVLPAGVAPPNPPELLARPVFSKLVGELAESFGVIIFDTPCGADSHDAQAIAGVAKAAMLVARKDVTRLRRAKAMCESLQESGGSVVGTVFNDF